MATVGRIVAGAGGASLVLWVLLSAIRPVILPRADPVLLSRWVFVLTRTMFDARTRMARTYERRDVIMASYAPIALMLLPAAWVGLVIAGFTGIFWALGVEPLVRAFELSGSSMLTLGFVGPEDVPTYLATFVQAALGLGLIALLIAYLPSIYGAFQRRELAVAKLAARAGDPPSAIEMIERHHQLARFDALDDLWQEWEEWFADIEETHTSQPALAFFRSITHERSWVTAAGVILDAAALRSSVLDLPRNPRAELCIRAGYLSLRRISAFFQIPFDADPSPDDPISIERAEFDAACDRLHRAGVVLRADRDQCWRDFAGWRVTYDVPLRALAGLAMAPDALWSSDRALPYRRPSLGRIRGARPAPAPVSGATGPGRAPPATG